MKEGSLDAPERLPLDWENPDFYDPEKLDAEMRRVFDICHGCRRCFNLCESFPVLFDLVDESSTGELDSVESEGFVSVVDNCTLCDMCFMTKCPYVPPHEFNLDFPHLMLRVRALEHKEEKTGKAIEQLVQTDRNGKVCSKIAPVVNWANSVSNSLTRPVLEKCAGIDRHAELPKFHGKTLTLRHRETPVEVNQDAPAFGTKAVFYATCFVNYNDPQMGMTARDLLAHNGVETEVVYPQCCGMPQLEQGNLQSVATSAKAVSQELLPWIEKGYDVIALVPSCALMMKQEWPLILPENEIVKRLSQNVFDLSEYIMHINKSQGLMDERSALDGGVTVHIACHARAQNMGRKAEELLNLIPDTDITVIERCSGHGGSWGIMKDHFETAIKVGKPVARQAVKAPSKYVVSECPLAAEHILQGMNRIEENAAPQRSYNPIELLAASYGLVELS